MGRRPYSEDIRGLVVGEVEWRAGLDERAARRFKVSASSAIRWVGFHNETGNIGPGSRKRKSCWPLEHMRRGFWILLAKYRTRPWRKSNRGSSRSSE